VTAIDESTGESTGVVGTSSPITVSPGGGTFKFRAQAVNGFGPGRLTEFDTGQGIFSGAELYAWGFGAQGSIGDNTTISRSSPVQVGALTSWASISVGNDNSVALKTDGTMWAWGEGTRGQLGDGTTISKSSPIQIGALTDWKVAVTGSQHCAAIRSGNSLWVWGYNNHGQLGNNTALGGTARSSPIQVGSLTNWAQVSTGAYSNSVLAITTGGQLYAWGLNTAGRLGDGTTISRSSPVQIGALTNWAFLATVDQGVGGAIKTDGSLWVWGANYNGQLGFNDRVYRSSPTQVGALTNWKELTTGNACAAIKTDGSLWSWGNNTYGSLGQNDRVYRSSPTQVGALTNWKSVRGNSSLTGAVKSDGTLWAWGSNFSGRLGDNTIVSRSSPVQIGALTNWAQVSTGSTHTTALQGVL
jgi:alpha-tubulin suppressor-like RCC1 family protein